MSAGAPPSASSTAMIGTEIAPLITALQMSALTGSIAVKIERDADRRRGDEDAVEAARLPSA